jgi:hypothetical protein
MRFATAVVVGTILIGAAGCTRHLPTGSKPVAGALSGSLGPQGSKAVTIAASRKVVWGKEEPATLIAQDRTRCIVTADKFRETAIGEQVTCDWRS